MRTNSVPQRRLLVLTLLLAAVLILTASGPPACEAWYPKVIEHKQTDTAIVKESQVQGWPPGYLTWSRSFADVAVSGDGTRIAFWVNVYVAGANHLFTANSDGTGLHDVTEHLPPNSPIGLLDINDDGSRIFGGGGEQNWYCDVSGPTANCARAVFSGIWSGDGNKPFTINTTGTELFFKHAANSDDKGLYTANLGGNPSKAFDLDTLPCDSECGGSKINLLGYLGAARSSGRMLFLFDRDYWGPTASRAMYYVDSGGSAVKIAGEEHDYVWDIQDINNDLISHDGSRALYSYDDKGDPNPPPEFHWVELPGGTKHKIANAVPDSNTTISADGSVVLFSSGGEYRATRVTLDTQDERDTGSYFIPNSSGQWYQSGLTNNNRYYYIPAGSSAPSTPYNYLRRVDLNPTSFNPAPDITDINCSAPALLHVDGATVAFTARVTDAQGLDNIAWVNLSVLVEGREQPSWPMGRVPLAFPSGDPGSTPMYDDGTHGDAVAGDGIFTFDAVATRKGDYEGFNTWYNHFTLPHDVGIRIIAKDKDENYTIADTRLTITDKGAAVPLLLLLE
ncbi:MAG: choice-of-anchor X domain-containing protein [Syntrophobacteraceae bacterium]